jgi:hypothetical protein
VGKKGQSMYKINKKIVYAIFWVDIALIAYFYNKSFKTIMYVMPVMFLFFCIIWFIETFKFRKFSDAFTFVHEPKPNPGTTLIDFLRENGYKEEDISYVKMMCFDLSNDYIRDFICELLKKNSSVSVDLFGCGEEFQVEGNVNFIKAEMPVEEHINVIGMKDGKICIGYEPVHTIYENKHSLPDGAFYSLSNTTNNTTNKENVERLYENICNTNKGKVTVPFIARIFKVVYNIAKSCLLYPFETTFISTTTGNIIRIPNDKHA